MGETPPSLSKLPSIAFTVLPAAGETVAILRGESAHYHIGSTKSPDELNRMYGVTRAQALAMLAGATYGWTTPLADPDNDDADGALLSRRDDGPPRERRRGGEQCRRWPAFALCFVPMRHALRSLRHRNFRLFYLGQLVSLSGTWMQSLAQAWLIYRLTGSGFMLGLASAATLAPSLVFGLYGGVLADRLSRRRLLIAAQVLAMLQALALAALTLGGAVEAWHILALALLLGVVQALELPVRHSFVASLVPRADLANAIALNASLFHASRLVGPAIAGVLVAAIGEGWVFFINALTFVAVLGVLLAIRLPHPAEARAPTGHGLHAGLSYVRQHAPIRAALSLVTSVALLGSAAAVLLPVFAVEVYAMGAQRLGFLMGAIGAGALVGAFLLAGRRDVLGLERVIAAAAIGVGLGLVLFAITPAFLAALPLLALIGLCITSVNASSNAFIQLAVPDSLRGRVMSLYSIALHGMVPLGSLAVGAAADVIGAPLTVAVCGVALAAATLYLGRPLRLAARKAVVNG